MIMARAGAGRDGAMAAARGDGVVTDTAHAATASAPPSPPAATPIRLPAPRMTGQAHAASVQIIDWRVDALHVHPALGAVQARAEGRVVGWGAEHRQHRV
jgi:hypothetical protein